MSCRAKVQLSGFVFLCLAFWPGVLTATECETAISGAASRTGVGEDLLLALALTESGRSGAAGLVSWPWTLNAGGEGYWFETREEAERALLSLLAQGQSNIDIGCFQINWRWHATGFSDAAAMLDPTLNADYAAEFLLRLYRDSGSWDAAVASYHSGTAALAEIYMNRFVPIYAAVLDRPRGDALLPRRVSEAVAARANLYPLLQAGEPATAGSLMPLSQALSPLIGPS